MKFSLIIPCYNEAQNIPLLLERCKKVANVNDIEVILVDNGSTDDTPNVLLQLLPNYPGCRSIKVEVNKGYGYGILSGLRAANGDIVGWTHADMQTDPIDALEALKLFDKFGNKIFVKGKRYGRPFSDVFFTFGMSIFETILLGKPLFDINAQPTIMTRTFFDSWVDPPHDFSLDLYAYYLARTENLEIHRFPTRFGDRAFGQSHWNVNWKSKWKFISRTVNFSLQLKKRFKS